MIATEVMKFANVLKRELSQWRETFAYVDIEVFVGCVLSDLLQAELITLEEEKYLRTYLIGK